MNKRVTSPETGPNKKTRANLSRVSNVEPSSVPAWWFWGTWEPSD